MDIQLFAQSPIAWVGIFVEFEPDDLPDVPHDLRPGMKKALVQVKSSDKSQHRTYAKLSALKRIVDSDLPAFIVHLEFNNGQVPLKARLLHIGTNEISHVQKCIRKAQHSGRIDFNNITVSLSLANAQQLSLDGSDAGDKIYEFIPSNPHEYAVSKAFYRKSCGYNEKSFVGGFNLAQGLSERDLALLMVGKIPNIPLSSFIIQGSRFGISLPTDRIEMLSGEITIDAKPFERGRVIARMPSGIKRAILPVNVYGTQSAAISPVNQMLRFHSEFLDIIVSLKSAEDELGFRIDPHIKYPIRDLSQALSFIDILQMAGAKISIEAGERKMIDLTLAEPAQMIPDAENLSSFCVFLADACSRLWADKPVLISLKDLSDALSSNLQMFAAATLPGANFVFSGGDNASITDRTRGIIYLPICISFAELTYSAIAQADAVIKVLPNERVSFVGLTPRIIEEIIMEESEMYYNELNIHLAEIGLREKTPELWIVTAKIGRSADDEILD